MSITLVHSSSPSPFSALSFHFPETRQLTRKASNYDLCSQANPTVQWIIIINPNSGPSLDPNDPSLYCVPTLRSVLPAGSIITGYVRTGYNARSLGEIEADVKQYASWKNIKVKGGKTPKLDGIFFDETSDTTTTRLQSFASIARTQFSNRLVKVSKIANRLRENQSS